MTLFKLILLISAIAGLIRFLISGRIGYLVSTLAVSVLAIYLKEIVGFLTRIM